MPKGSADKDLALTTDSLTIYAIRRRIDGKLIDDFDDAIESSRLEAADDKRDFESSPNMRQRWAARMYLWKGASRRPPWAEFIEKGFGGDRIDVTGSAQDCAVVVVKVKYRVERLYAIPFGLRGRFQIRRDVVDPRYGLRVALNLLYEGDMPGNELDAAPRVHQVESKSVSANTMRTIRQANRRTDFEDFDLNPDIDLLSGITGQPRDADLARRVRGTDSLRIGRRIGFHELGDLCRNIARAHERSYYQRRFRFVDQRHGIDDPSKVAKLTDQLRESLRANPSTWAFSIPGVLDFDQVSDVRIAGNSFVDPTVNDVISCIGINNLAKHLSTMNVEVIDSDGHVTDRCRVFECLDGQIVTGNETILLEEGTFYQIEPDYLAQLDQDIDAIPDSSVTLPVSTSTQEVESAYNERASEPANHFLLDKKTVVVPGKTSPIEVCDILTQDRQLVHVKRKFSSSALSHLFGQGFVSAELLVDNEAFRARVREKIGSTFPRFQNLFPECDIVAADWEIVYAIIGPWNSEPASAKLPFFSKVNLREFRRRLRRMGFNVSLARVAVSAIDPSAA